MQKILDTPLVSVPEPKQARSRDALDRLLEVGEALLASNQFEEATIVDIALQAQSSVGSFYRLLGDKETLLLLLLQRFFENAQQRLQQDLPLEICADETLQQVVIRYASFVNQVYHGRRGVLRAVILRASQSAQFRDRVHQLNDDIAQHMAMAMTTHAHLIKHPLGEAAIPVAAHMCLGILNQHTVTGSLGGIPEATIVNELARVFISYLTTDVAL